MDDYGCEFVYSNDNDVRTVSLLLLLSSQMLWEWELMIIQKTSATYIWGVAANWWNVAYLYILYAFHLY